MKRLNLLFKKPLPTLSGKDFFSNKWLHWIDCLKSLLHDDFNYMSLFGRIVLFHQYMTKAPDRVNLQIGIFDSCFRLVRWHHYLILTPTLMSFKGYANAHGPSPSQQHAVLQKQGLSQTSGGKSWMDGGAIRCQHILVSHVSCTPMI